MPKLPTQPLPQNATREQAQIAFGLYGPHDKVMSALIAATWIIMAFKAIFGTFDRYDFITGMLISIAFGMTWMIALLYRVLVWQLDIQADINLMPEAAARIVVGYYEKK